MCEAHQNFGLLAIKGPGSTRFPPIIGTKRGPHSPHGADGHFSLYTRPISAIEGSNFSTEDVATTHMPWYYSCSSCSYTSESC